MRNVGAKGIIYFFEVSILLLMGNLLNAEEPKTPVQYEKPTQEYIIQTKPPTESKPKETPLTPPIGKPMVSTEKPDYPKKPTPEKGVIISKEIEKIKPFTVSAGYEYTFLKDPNTFLKKENPLNVSATMALKEITPEDLLKAKATELRIEIEPVKKIPIITTEAKIVPVTYGQLATIKSLAEAVNDTSFLRQINLVIEQADGDFMTYGTKNVGKETFADVIIYSKKRYLRDLYLPERFKQNLDKYLGTSLLITGAKDRVEKGDVAIGKLLYQKAANISDNNPYVLKEAAKTLLGVK